MRVAGTPGLTNASDHLDVQSHYITLTNWPMKQSKGTGGLGAGPMAPAWSRRTVPRASSLGLTRLLEIDRKGDHWQSLEPWATDCRRGRGNRQIMGCPANQSVPQLDVDFASAA
ncbi:hypothetical protein H0G86_012094 [Trichoderma simmonsii]|uniref:Uncharacterized protein n=1 Tax=Trichoderma simmonsii TaxID=1491479 RepID=A0A8G0LRU4_9HYPO|nr:hypothetical protein H0G86_012094 [Trichoderma simmonsii]